MALYTRSPRYPTANNPGLSNLQNQSKPSIKDQQQKPQKRINENALLLLHYLTHQNIVSKLRLSFSKMKKNQKDSNERSIMIVAILKALFKRKTNQNLRSSLSNIQNASISSMISTKKAFDDKKKISKEKAVLILSSILNNLQKMRIKNIFADLSKKLTQKRLINSYRVSLLFGSLNRIILRKQKQGWTSLINQDKKFYFRKKGLLKINTVCFHRSILFKSSALSLIRLIGAKRTLQEKQEKPQIIPSATVSLGKPILTATTAAQKAQNIYVEQYKKLQMELQSLQANHEAVIQQYKNQIQSLQQKNDGLRFNYEFLESQNMELEKQIINSQQRSRRKVSMKEVWQQIYRNLLFFLYKNVQSSVSKQDILNVLEMPLVKINYSVDSLKQENQVLRELIEEYKKIGMQPKNQIAVESLQTHGNIILSHYPFDVILKCNKYYYDVIDVLAEKGLGKVSQIDAFKQQLQSFIAKTSDLQ